jgi:hypothetical protein
LGSKVGRTWGNVGKAQKHFFSGNKGAQKIMEVRNIHVLVGENYFSYSIINGSENDFMDNLYDHGLPMSSN